MSYIAGSDEEQTGVFYKEWWFILLMVLFFVILILLIIGFAFICYRRRKRKLSPGGLSYEIDRGGRRTFYGLKIHFWYLLMCSASKRTQREIFRH